jgi:predicted dehydrogenase
MNEIKMGVVGVGHIGKEHARIYADLPMCRLVGVFDANRDQAQSIAKKYKTVAFETLEALREAVDGVSIATPTFAHFDAARVFLSEGKPVLIEKPITDSPEQARELVQIAKEKQSFIQVGHIERFNPVLTALEQMLSKPRFIEAHRLSPYPNRSTDIGVVLDLMIHDLDVILHLVHSPIESIDAVGVPVLSKGEDIANARIRFENGCVANITTSRISPEKMRKIRVFQDDTYLSLDYQNQSGEVYRKMDGKIVRDKVQVQKEEPLKLELASFVDCVRMKQTPRVSGEQGTRALEIAMQITEMIWANRK